MTVVAASSKRFLLSRLREDDLSFVVIHVEGLQVGAVLVHGIADTPSLELATSIGTFMMSGKSKNALIWMNSPKADNVSQNSELSEALEQDDLVTGENGLDSSS